jgi:hypothetical protein
MTRTPHTDPTKAMSQPDAELVLYLAKQDGMKPLRLERQSFFCA